MPSGRYNEVEFEKISHESPAQLLADLLRIEVEIAERMGRLEEMGDEVDHGYTGGDSRFSRL